MGSLIDSDGFRHNVGIVLSNDAGRVFWARRCGMDAWQFPQGGIREGESPEQAMFRELQEEIGLSAEQVQVVGRTQGWLSYRLPERYIRHHCKPVCIGQKQIWFILRLLTDASAVSLDTCKRPEFDCWRWVDYWYPLHEVVVFKRDVYQRALNELEMLVFPGGCRSSYR